MSDQCALLGYRRKEVIGDATLYLADCRDILPLLKGVHAVVADPPYGIAFSHSGGAVRVQENLNGLMQNTLPNSPK